MSVTYTGTFWSAVTRALLSLRRDKSLTMEDEATALSALGNIESGDYPITALNEKLALLSRSDSPQKIGQSLLGYLDFNKMGTFHCFLSMARDINAALKHENIGDKLASKGYGPATKSTPDNVLARLKNT